MPHASPDVLVIGGGPAGATTAASLARVGVRVTLVDRSHFPREKPCAEYISPRVALLLHELGFGAVSAVPGSRPLRGMRIHSPWGSAHLVDYAAAGAGATAYAVRRWHFDAALLEWAARCGVEVVQGVRAIAVDQPQGGRVSVELRSGGGARWRMRAPLVIGADGLHSVCSRGRRWDRPVRWPRRLGLVAHYEGVQGADDHGAMFVGLGSYCGLAPLGDDTWSVAAVVPLARGRMSTPEELFDETVRAHPTLRQQLEHARRISPIRGIGPMSKRVSRVSGGQVLLVGDAAGFFDPFTGEGIHRAVRGAQLAAGSVRHALDLGDLSDRTLAAYDRQRRRELMAKERLCALIQLFVCQPRLLELAVGRLNRRPETARFLARTLGDLIPASDWGTARALAQLIAPIGG